MAIAPGTLGSPTDVSFTPVAADALPMAVPAEWRYLAAYNLSFSGDALSAPAQLAIPVADSVPVGERVFLMRYGQIPNAQGNLSPTWWQDEVAVVGADHIAARAARHGRGSRFSGVYLLNDAPGGYSLVQGILTVNFPISISPMAATLLGVMATFSPMFAVSIDVSRVTYVAIPKDGLPVTTDVGVSLSAGATSTVSVSLSQSPALEPTAPTLKQAQFEFAQPNGVRSLTDPKLNTTPVVVLDGSGFTTTPHTALASTLAPVWHQDGMVFAGVPLGGVTVLGDGTDQLVVSVPQEVIAGLAQLSLVRADTVIDSDNHRRPVQVQRNYESNRITLSPTGDYVVSGSFGCLSGCDASSGGGSPAYTAELDVFTQGDPSVPDPTYQGNALQQLAQIPIGKPWGAAYPGTPSTGVRDTALTPDRTRAYATLNGQSSVAVVDMLAMQQVDAVPGSCSSSCQDSVNQIYLPTGAQPFWIALDKQGKYAYVSDYLDYGTPSAGQGRIYVIDIDPTSCTFNTVVRTIDVKSAGQGLRQLVVSDDGRRLYVAAPNRDGSIPPPATAPSTSYPRCRGHRPRRRTRSEPV